jgi:phenylpropionate dioxygenase-like ring-hydroxylating dioxygenase large terminal subunit
MLTRAQNDLLTQTDAGTPGGALMRRYWQPAGLSEEIPPNSAPKPVRILGEDLVLFRDDRGEPGLMGILCPHRRCDLSYGRIEHGGLRCIYHGWLFARDGRCLEQPGEGPESTFKDKVRNTAYPCHEANGIIWTYMGDGTSPQLPAFPFLSAPSDRVWVTKVWNECNYLQGSEGNVDPQHLSFLHRMFLPHEFVGESRIMYTIDVAPRLLVEETGFGLRAYAVRDTDENTNYVRISNFVMPNGSLFDGVPIFDPLKQAPAPNLGYQAHWHVPIDDTHHWKYVIVHGYEHELERAYLDRTIKEGLDEQYRGSRTAENRYLQDRGEMNTRAYAGLGLNFQDHDRMAIESLGPILDRSQERLGTTDRPVIAMRRQMLEAIDDVQQGRAPLLSAGGEEPVRDLVVCSEKIPKKRPISHFWESGVPA